MTEHYLAKIVKNESEELVIKIPKELALKLELKPDAFINVHLDSPSEYIVEVEKAVLDELHEMQSKMPMYKDKPINDILKDIMFKFNDKNHEHKIPDKKLKVVEKGSDLYVE